MTRRGGTTAKHGAVFGLTLKKVQYIPRGGQKTMKEKNLDRIFSGRGKKREGSRPLEKEGGGAGDERKGKVTGNAASPLSSPEDRPLYVG